MREQEPLRRGGGIGAKQGGGRVEEPWLDPCGVDMCEPLLASPHALTFPFLKDLKVSQNWVSLFQCSRVLLPLVSVPPCVPSVASWEKRIEQSWPLKLFKFTDRSFHAFELLEHDGIYFVC